jgi:hypothetical protein
MKKFSETKQKDNQSKTDILWSIMVLSDQIKIK